MAETYFNQDDLHRYLDRSICIYEGTPVYVSTASYRYPLVGIFRLDGRLNKAWKVVDHSEKALDDRSPTLGYINTSGNAYYLTRVPYRHQTQGIRLNSMQSTPHLGQYKDDGSHWFYTEDMSNCILGKYPSYAEAWELLEEHDLKGVAIHRHLALSYISRKNMGLYYKGRLVAHWSPSALQWDYFQNSDTTHMERVIRKLGVL